VERSPVLFRLAPRLALLLALAVAAYAALALAVPRAAHAQNKQVEAQARQLQKKAMDEDYLSTEFGKASDKLNKAMQLCGTDKCSAQLRAQLKRDLGVVQIGGQINKDEGVRNFAEAMSIDPAVALDPDLKTKDLEEAWEKAKKGSGTGPATGPAPAGDFTHTPVAMQLVRTPVPIYAEYGGTEAIVKVVARYKAFGMTEWKSAELKKLGKGWGGQIPCLDVIQGDLQYYLQGFNEQNDPVATAGDRNHPYKVPVKRDKIEGDPPHLPDQPPPAQCADTGDCPPDFPGCHTGKPPTGDEPPKGKGEDEDCEEDAQCASNKCKNNKCTKPEDKSSGYRKLWIGASIGVEFTLVGSADDVCKLSQDAAAAPLNTAGYYCVDSGGADYPDRNDRSGQQNLAIVKDGKTDKVSGGGTLGNLRLLLSLEYAFSANILAGIRGGIILLRYPGTAAANDGKASQLGPVHIEARGTYVIGKDALAKAGTAPYIMVAAGYGEFSGKVAVSVRETGVTGTKQVDAWALGGPIFAALGGGIRYAFSPRAALLAGPRLNLAFGNAGVTPSFGLEAGMQFGF
jgi:hypothetical protein